MKPENSQENQEQQQEYLTHIPAPQNLKILKRDPRASSSDEDEQSAKNSNLFLATRKRDIAKIAKLLKEGADINAKNEKEKTVLHIAIEKDYKDVVVFLKCQGIKTDIPNKDGKTALDLAKDLKKHGIIQILENNNEQVADLPEGVMLNKNKLEAEWQSTQTRKSIPATHGEDSANGTRSDVGEVVSKNKYYHKGGLVHNLHGNIYQLKLQMLFLKRAIDKGYAFNLGTEVENADKFDDIVFKYKRKDDTGGDKIRFLQAKHRQDETKKINAHDLLTKKNDDFSLQKYFISYRKIKKNLEFNKYELKDFILCTNIGFDLSDLENAGIKTKEVKENDDILDVTKSGDSAILYNIVDENHTLYETLQETSDLHRLAKELKDHIVKDKPIHLTSDIFKLYHGPLSKTVFEIEAKKEKNKVGNNVIKKYATFSDNFLKNHNLSEEVCNFRNVLQLALEKDDDAFQVYLNTKELSVSSDFGEIFELQMNPSIRDTKKFAKTFSDIVSEAQDNIITIPRETTKTGIIKDNIDKLAGHILVQCEGEGDKKDLIRFREVFFDDDNKLAANLKDFKVALKGELQSIGIDFSKLKQYKYKISKFKTCEETPEGELLYCKPKLPNDKIEDTAMEEFFEKLVFALNQPNEVDLGKIIAKELGEDSQFNLLNSDLVADSFQREMLDWFKAKGKEKGKEGVFLDAADAQRFFNSIEQQVNSLISIGVSLAYSEKLQSYGVKFDTNDVFDHFKTFLATENTTKIFHLVATEETILSAIKVYWAMEDLKQIDRFAQYKKHDGYIFMRLSELLLRKTQKRVIDSFKSSNGHDLFIIDCKSAASADDIQGLYNELSNNLSKTNKKIILIATKDDALARRFATDAKYKSAVDGNSFQDLTEESQQRLLGHEVILQGQRVSLNKLIDKSDEKAKQIIDAEILVKLIKGDEISIGNKLKDLGDVNDYYIDRNFRKVTFNKEKIKNDFQKSTSSKSDLFVISGTDSGLEGNNIYAFDNAETAGQKFKELCDQNVRYNIHWLESHSQKLTWYKSYGSISNLVQYRIREKVDKTDNIPPRLIEEDKFTHKDNHNKIVVISDTAGMGKSTVLTSISMELKKDSSLWVIRINLNDYTKVLNEALIKKSSKFKFSNQDISKVVNFLLNDLLASQEQSKLKTNLEKKVFKHCFNNHGKLALLFDGFDEISPDYKDIVIDMLQSLKNSKVKKLFVATRPNMNDVVEDALEVFSHVLEPFSKGEQIKFLIKFWTKKLKLENLDKKYTKRLKTYAETVIEHISKSINDKEQGFIGIPLQTMMLAEVFQENQEGAPSAWQSCKEFLESEQDKPNLTRDFALLDLYEHFVKRKFYEFYLVQKKGRDFTKVGEKKSADTAYKLFKENNAILALHTLFNEKDLKEILSQETIKKLKGLIADIKSAEQNEGLVDQIIDDKPHFIHRTFAEYFASFPIAEKMLATPANTLQCIDTVLFNTSPIFINSIIEQLDGKQEIITSALKKPLLHFVIIKKHSNFIKSLLKSGYKDWAEKLDSSKRTPLHYAIMYGHCNIVKILLEYANDIHENIILKHGSLKKTEYENTTLVKFINTQDKYGNTALYYAMQEKYIDLAFELLLKGASIDSLTDVDVNTLIDKMLYYDTHRDLYNNGILAVYANQENKYRPIQENLLLKTPDIFKELTKKDQSRLLSYFFVHGRLKVIKALLETIEDLEQRKEILNNDDNGYTPLDRVNHSDQLSDDDRLEITKYLLAHHDGITSSTMGVGFSNYNTSSNNYITQILQAAAQHGHIKTFEYFIAEENHDYYHLHLRQAVEYKHHNIIKYLSENYKDNINEGGNTALHTACDSVANLKSIKYLIDNGDINATNNKGETPLFMAIYACAGLNVIEYLVSKGSDVNWKDEYHNTPLSYAVESDQVDIINYLLKKNAHISENASRLIKDKVAVFKNLNYNLDLVDEHGSPRLHTAIKSSNFEWAKFLVRKCADINKVDAEGKTPLHWAAEVEHVEIVELLLQYGAFFDKKDSNNSTPRNLLPCNNVSGNKIIWLLDVLNKLFSSQNLMQDLNEELLKPKSRNSLKDWGPYGQGHPDAWDGNNPMLFVLNARNSQGKTLLHTAAVDTNGAQAINILFNFNHDYLGRREESRRYPRYQDHLSISSDIVDSQGNTPLHLAAQKGHYLIVSLLLEKGAIFNIKNFRGETPEVLASNNKHSDIVKLLQQTKNLFIAIEENNISEVENCINEGTYNNAKNQSGKTPLHLATSFGHLTVVQLLLNNGADIEAVDLNENTPLHTAAKNDEIKSVKLLLKYGAIYNAKNTQGQRPLDLAHNQSYDLLEQIDTLFKYVHSDNPQLNINDLKMMHKTYEIDISTIINTRDDQVNTLLHYAARACEFNIVELLLECGAIFNSQNKFKMTPIDLTNDRDITSLLKAIENIFDNVDNIFEEQQTVSIKIITNVRDDKGRGLLHHAAESDNLEMVQFLVEKGSDVNSIDIKKLGASQDIIDYLKAKGNSENHAESAVQGTDNSEPRKEIIESDTDSASTSQESEELELLTCSASSTSCSSSASDIHVRKRRLSCTEQEELGRQKVVKTGERH